jgi:monoamine oxidase
MGNTNYDSTTLETRKRLGWRNWTIRRGIELAANQCNHALEGQNQ